MASYLVTGASRGFGLELVTQLANDASVGVVIATCRAPESAHSLKALAEKFQGKLHVFGLDVTDENQAKRVAEEAKKVLPSGLDFLINNAGINREPSSVVEVPASEFTRLFLTNCVGAQNVTSALMPLLREGKEHKVANISSYLGSITLSQGYPFPAYSTSKCALNFLTRHYALEFAKEGFTFLAIDPGYMPTDMGGPHGTDPVPQNASAILKILREATPEKNGAFIKWTGDIHPW